MESTFTLNSPAFKNGSPIPDKYAYKTGNLSPPLQWVGAPANTKSFVLINDDPDAPSKVWTHWVLWNIPADCKELKEGVGVKASKIMGDISQGITDFGDAGYGGPAPPSGVHKYMLKLYALSDTLKLSKVSGKKKVEDAMKALILAKAELMGTYAAK